MSSLPRDLREAQRVAARAAARVQVRDVRTVAGEFKFQNFPEQGLSYGLHIDFEIDYAVGDPAILLAVEYQTSIDSTNEQGEEFEVADVKFTLALLATITLLDDEDPLAEEEVEAYCATTGTFALYPYAREYLQSVTTRMGLPALTLSVLRLPSEGPAEQGKPEAKPKTKSRVKPRAKQVPSK